MAEDVRMSTAQSMCRCHPAEVRDARFALLDALIDAGWGSVPMYLIERAIEKNRGVLPPAPTSSPSALRDLNDAHDSPNV
jgi:hypothetical protein